MSTVRTTARFETWGTYVHLETGGRLPEAERLARGFLDEVDRACSRFRPDSELSAVNRRAGHWVPSSPLLITALAVALEAARVSDGLVDPLLGRTLVELGYDADFATLTPRASGAITSARPDAWREIEIDRAGSAVRIPVDTALDLGATCKAWAADVLATTVSEELDTPTLVSLGGDVRIAAPPGVRRSWPIRITEHPDGNGDDLPAEEILLDDGGLATSSTRVRRWRHGGEEVHHLLDPTTGRPVFGPWRTVTATGPSCVAANVATTAALVLADRALAWLGRHDVDARLISTHGRIRRTGRWPGALDEVAS